MFLTSIILSNVIFFSYVCFKAWRLLSNNKITSQEFLTIGANIIGKHVDKVELLHDEMLRDIRNAHESYYGQFVIPNLGLEKHIFFAKSRMHIEKSFNHDLINRNCQIL